MKHADRLKVAASALSSATLAVGEVITMGAAVTGCRTLAQAIADGANYPHAIRVGDTSIPFIVEDNIGNWLAALFTLTSTTQITLTQILSSSTGGNPVTFSGALPTVFSGDSAFALNSGLTNPHDPGLDIVICAGQSNMVGVAAADTSIDVTDPRVFAFGGYPSDAATYRKITLATDPLKHFGGPDGMGPSTWFAKTYAGMIPSNRKVLLVPVAWSGTSLLTAGTHWWGPGDGSGSGIAPAGDLFENAIAQANSALATAKLMYPASRIVGTIWLQGESDAGLTRQLPYSAALKALIQGFRLRMTGAANMWFVIGGMQGGLMTTGDGSGTPGSWFAAVDAAHQQVAAEVPRCAYAPGVVGYPFSGSNLLHYNNTGYRLMGCAMGVAYATAATSKGIDTTAPTIMSAIVYSSATSTVAVTLSEPFDPAYPPQASAWSVSGHTVTAAGGSGNVVYLTVSAAFVNGEAARTVSFTAPGNGLRDLAGNLMASQSGVSITNNAPAIDSIAPTLSGATVANATPATLTMTASETLDTGYTPAASAFTVSGHTVTSITVNANTVVIGLGEAFVNGEASRTVAYTQPASNGTRDVAGNLMTTFSGLAVTNNVVASDTTAPTVSSAQVANGSPTVIQITMSETLANSTPPTSAFAVSGGKTVSSVGISGAIVSVTVNSAYASGDTITATYTAPGADPRIKDASGNVTTSFGPLSVTNNVAAATVTDMRFADLYLMSETSAVAPFAYKANSGVNYSAVNNGGTSQIAAAGDFTFTVKVGTVSTGQQMIGLKTASATTAYANTLCNFMAKTSGYGAFSGTVAAPTVVNGSIIPADNDLMRVSRSGSVVTASVSKDAGSTWTTILTWPTVNGTLYVQIISASNGTFVAPQGTGFA